MNRKRYTLNEDTTLNVYHVCVSWRNENFKKVYTVLIYNIFLPPDLLPFYESATNGNVQKSRRNINIKIII